MSQPTRSKFIQATGWILVISGLLIIAGEFVESGLSFHAFVAALKEGFYICLLGALLFASERIHQLQQENAALRGAMSDAERNQNAQHGTTADRGE